MTKRTNWVGMMCVLSAAPQLFAAGCGGGSPAEVCGSGTWDDDGDAATDCVAWTACVAGEYQSVAGTAESDRECEVCGTGTYSALQNQSTCLAHGMCLAGTTQTAAGTSMAAPVCTACMTGEYCAGGAAPAAACGSNAWDHDGNPATACAMRTDCEGGHYVSDDGSPTTNRTCATCASGSFSTPSNSTRCTTWQVCGAGYVESVAGSDTMDRTCGSKWTRQFGTASDDGAESMSVGSDGSVLVAGFTYGELGGTNTGSSDGFVRKYDASGTTLWTRQIGTAEYDVAVSVSVGDDGSVLVAGHTGGDLGGTGNAGLMDAFVRKYDASGTVLWTRQFGTAYYTDVAVSVSVGDDGSVLVAGHTDGDLGGTGNVGLLDAFVRKYDASGTVLWTRQFGTAAYDYTASVSVGSDGSVLVAGYTRGDLGGMGNAGGMDAFVRKYDTDGIVLWTRQSGATYDDFAVSVSVGSDGSVLVAGQTEGDFGGTINTDALLWKYDANGNELWTRQFGTAGYEGAEAVSVGSDGSVLVTGFTSGDLDGTGNAGSHDAFVRQYDAGGAALWTRQFGTANTEYAESVSLGSDGSVLVAGSTNGDLSGTGNYGGLDAFVMALAAP